MCRDIGRIQSVPAENTDKGHKTYLLALNLPASAPWWIGVVGGVFAILVVKMLFGGLGQNFMNPPRRRKKCDHHCQHNTARVGLGSDMRIG